MTFRRAKLFQKKENNQENIYAIAYDTDVEYCTYLRNMFSDGYKEIAITSEIMLNIIKTMCATKGYSIYEIEFDEEDEELNQEVDTLIKKVSSNPEYLTVLMDMLKSMSEEMSVNIKRIYMKGKYEEYNVPNFFIQSNGIVGINQECYEQILGIICDEVKRCFSKETENNGYRELGVV